MTHAREYFMRGSWGARPETPDELAVRFLRYIDHLGAIDPLFGLWIGGSKGPRKLESIRDQFAQHVAAEIVKDDFGVPLPEWGYSIGAYTRGQPQTSSYAVRISAAANRPIPEHQNQVLLVTSSRSFPDPTAIAYPVFKSAMIAMIEAWEPSDCLAVSYDLLDAIDWSMHFHESWIQYLSAPLAQLITPPSRAIVEHLPNGGILMAATDETFDLSNAAHLSVARDIALAIAPLNELPYAGNRPRNPRR